jgi:hypothetical protein
MAIAARGSLSQFSLPAPVPLTKPNMPVPQAPTIAPFTGQPPTPTAQPAFGGLNPATFEHSPDYQYLQDEMQKSLQRSAAARGTLLTGGFLKSLARNTAGIAAGDYGNQFNRDLSTYNTNRDTNAQNFNQGMQQFQGSLSAHNANAENTLDAGRFALDTERTAYDQGLQGAEIDQANAQGQNNYTADMNNANQAAAFAAQVEEARRQQAGSLRSLPAAPFANPSNSFAAPGGIEGRGGVPRLGRLAYEHPKTPILGQRWTPGMLAELQRQPPLRRS